MHKWHQSGRKQAGHRRVNHPISQTCPKPTTQKLSRRAVFIFSWLDYSQYFEPAPPEIKKVVQEIYTNIAYFLYNSVSHRNSGVSETKSGPSLVKSLDLDQVFAIQAALYYSILQAFCDA